jgi:hypothetical protein
MHLLRKSVIRLSNEERKPKKDDEDVVENRPSFTKQLDIDYNLYLQFDDYLILKYNNDHDKIAENIQMEIQNIFKNGINVCRQQLSSSETNLLFRGRIPRKDVLQKLGKIASLMFKTEHYPYIKNLELIQILKKILEPCDERTMGHYKNCIFEHSNKDPRGYVDVSSFISLVPKQYMAE